MTQPGSLPNFRVTVVRDQDEHPYLISCAVEDQGEAEKFHTATRRFRSTEELSAVLEHAGIAQGRYRDIVAGVGAGSGAGATKAFEIDLVEGQRLGIVHTDSPE